MKSLYKESSYRSATASPGWRGEEEHTHNVVRLRSVMVCYGVRGRPDYEVRPKIIFLSMCFETHWVIYWVHCFFYESHNSNMILGDSHLRNRIQQNWIWLYLTAVMRLMGMHEWGTTPFFMLTFFHENRCSKVRFLVFSTKIEFLSFGNPSATSLK